MPFRKAGLVDEVPPGCTRYRVIEGTPVLLVNQAGRIYATAGLCPHRGNPLRGATVCEHLVDCPWHHFQYDVRTGENHYPRNVYPPDLALTAQLRPLRVYNVEVRHGEIWVDLD